MLTEPKFYEALAREYMQDERIDSVNWRLAIKGFAAWLDERAHQGADNLPGRMRGAATCIGMTWAEQEVRQRCFDALYDGAAEIERLRSPDLKSLKVEGAVLMSGTVEVGTIVAVERESDKPFPFEDIPHALHAPECSWGCHYVGDELVRNPACTVHGASRT